MAKTRIVTAPLALASALFLLLAGPLTAAPACSGAKIPAKAADTQERQSIQSQAELSTALQNARGGETFVLGPGHYGKLTLRSNYKSPVTIRSANPEKPACFTGLSLKGVNNVVLDRLYFDYIYKNGDQHFIYPFSISESRNIQIANSVFDGDIARGTNSEADGYSFGIGLRIGRSSDIRIAGSEFRKWWTAIISSQSARQTFSGKW